MQPLSRRRPRRRGQTQSHRVDERREPHGLSRRAAYPRPNEDGPPVPEHEFRHMTKFGPAFVRAGAALLTLILAATPYAGRAQDAVLKVATIPIDTGAEAFYALDQGFFKKAGLDVSIERITNGPAIAAAVASGAVDVGFSNLVSLAIAFKKGVPITLIAAAGMYSTKAPTTNCQVALNSPIK